MTLAAPAAASDCAAISQASLTIEPAPGASAVRILSLEAGDTLTFTFASYTSVLGVVTLTASAAEPRPLLAGQSGTNVDYRVKATGAHAFRFATEGGEGAAFTVACTPARTAARTASRAPSPAARRASALIAEDRGRLSVASGDAAAAPLHAPAAADSDPSAIDRAGAVASPRKDVGPANTWLQWEGVRNPTGGPESVEREEAAGATNLGVKYRLQPAIMVGVLAQFEPAGESLLGPRSLSERNWLVGPVTTLKLAPGVSLDARAGWGALETGTPGAVGHATDRRLLDARLANTQELGAWRFSPSVGLNYFEETRHPTAAVPDAFGPLTTKGGRVDVRPEVAYRIDLDRAMFIEPKAMIGGFWDIDNPALQVPGTAMHQGVRLKAETGVTIGSSKGGKLQIGGGVEEGGPAAANVWNGRLQFDVPLK